MLLCIRITITAVLFVVLLLFFVIYLFIYAFCFVVCLLLSIKLLMSLRSEAGLSIYLYVPSTVIFIVKFPITKP